MAKWLRRYIIYPHVKVKVEVEASSWAYEFPLINLKSVVPSKACHYSTPQNLVPLLSNDYEYTCKDFYVPASASVF